MQTYKIIGHSAILGVGLTLKLTKAQAATRTSLLKQKKKDICRSKASEKNERDA